jgi:hypothetical protein
MISFKRLVFRSDFHAETEQGFARAQKYVDSEVLRLSDPYVPFDTGMLKKSGISGTVLGSGVVEYTAPYARLQYYTNAGRGKQGVTKQNTHNYKCLRGKLWFERMKADHKDEILNGLKKIK